MSKEYLPDKEKRILLSALSHEMKLVKDNNLTELIPVVKNLDYKFMYDRLFKKIEGNAYQQGRTDERERIIKELEEFAKNPCEGKYCKYPDDPENPHEDKIGCERCVALRAIEIVRGEHNEKS